MISDNDLKQVTLQVKEQADKFAEGEHPTEFELMTAVAFTYFAQQGCDIVVSEVGMGGRLDSTNVIEADETVASVLTSIDYDHMQFLGNTLEEIAAEKAGIFKSGVPIVSADQKPEVKKVLQKKACDLGCKISFIDSNAIKIEKVDLSKDKLVRYFKYKNDVYTTSLIALYQPNNAALAIEACDLLKTHFNRINDVTIKNGIINTQWRARFEIISKRPTIVLDGGHNIQGVNALIDSLKDVFGSDRYVFVMGVLADKDYEEMVKLVSPLAKKVYTITPPNPRALSAEELAKCFEKYNTEVESVTIDQAIKIAENNSQADDVVVAFGSLYSISSL